MASRKKIEAGEAQIYARIKDGVGAGLAKIRAKLTAFAAGTAKIGAGAIGTASLVLAPMAAAVNTFADSGDQFDKMAARTGASVENLSTLAFAADEAGGEVVALEDAIKDMQKSMTEAKNGSTGKIDALQRLGYTYEDLAGKTPTEQLKMMADGLAAIPDVGERAAAATAVMGESGRKILPMLSAGADGISAMQAKARDLGLQMSTDDATNAAKLTDSFYELWSVIKASTVSIGAALAPSLIKIVDLVVSVTKHVIGWIQNNGELITAIAATAIGVASFGAVLIGLGMGAAAAAAGITLATTAATAAGAVLGFLLSPVGMISAALIGGVGAWLYYSGTGAEAAGWLQTKLGELLGFGRMVFGGVFDAIVAGDWSLAGSIMWTALKIAFNTGVGLIMAPWLDFKHAFLGVFDAVVVAFRSTWSDVVNWIAKSISIIIGHVNSVSETLLGFSAIDWDAQLVNASLDAGNDQFKKQLQRDAAARQSARENEKTETLAAFDTAELSRTLSADIAKATAARAEFEASKAADNLKLDALKAQAPPEVSTATVGTRAASFGSFSAAVLATFNGSTDDRTAKATEQSAKTLAKIDHKIATGKGLVIT